jgi:type I restriction enzyme S subunit
MCDGWTASTLSEVVTLQRGFDLPLQNRRPGLVPILGSFGVTGWHDVAPVNGPGVTIGRSGNIGTAAYTDADYWPLNTTLFVRDFHGNEPRFVFYLLKAIDFAAYNSGSVQPSLNRNYIARIQVKLPPRVEQSAIAEVLGALDEKIDSNRIIAQRADELWYCEQARVLNGWDVGDDTVLPSGWSRAPLSSLARFVNGRNFTKGATGSGRMVVRIAELNSGPGRSTIYNAI